MNAIPPNQLAALRILLATQRIAVLAVAGEAAPTPALVTFALEAEKAALLLHLSSLSSHKQALLQYPECSLLVHEQDDGRGQPLLLKRAALRGHAEVIPKIAADFASAAAAYVEKLPANRMLFSLGDFDLFRVRISDIRFVAGFGQAFTLPGQILSETASESH